jgi:hypothetical protein
MALAIEQEQRTFVGHRMNFWGHPSSFDTVSWEYEGRPWLVNRPDDGSPALHRSVQCGVCAMTLNYTVHSVAATRRRRAHRRAWAFVGFAVSLGALFSPFVIGVGDVRTTIAIAAAGLGVGTGMLCMFVAARETGLTGHGASWPGYTKHMVTLPEYDPLGLPLDLP